MNQYIKTDALIKFIDNRFDITWEHDYEGGIKDACMDILEEINKQPIADVRENVHGEWIKTTIAEGCGTDELHRTIYRDRETVKCSKCGNPSPIYNIKFEFCPICGADMRTNNAPLADDDSIYG